MPNQSKSSKGSNQSNRDERSNRDEKSNRGEQPNRGQQSNQGQQSSQGKQASGSVQSSRDNPSRKGAAGEREEGNVSFRCADVGHPECSWQASGRNEEELFPKIEQHGRDKHGIKTFDNQTREKIRGAIRPQAA